MGSNVLSSADTHCQVFRITRRVCGAICTSDLRSSLVRSDVSASACRELRPCRVRSQTGSWSVSGAADAPLSATTTRSLPWIFAWYNASSAALNSPSTLWPLSGNTATPNDSEMVLWPLSMHATSREHQPERRSSHERPFIKGEQGIRIANHGFGSAWNYDDPDHRLRGKRWEREMSKWERRSESELRPSQKYARTTYCCNILWVLKNDPFSAMA